MDPQSRSIPILITRPEPQASRFAKLASVKFDGAIRLIFSPLLQPRFLPFVRPEIEFHALVLTSETGALAAGRLIAEGEKLPSKAFCVGDRTAMVAQNAGFDAVSAGPDAEGLFQSLVRFRSEGPFLHLRGREARGDLAARLRAKQIAAEECIVYAQEAVPLSSEAIAAIHSEPSVIVPLFSPRSAKLFFQGLEKPNPEPNLIVIAMSEAVASNCRQGNVKVLKTADRPDATAMLSAMSQVLFGA